MCNYQRLWFKKWIVSCIDYVVYIIKKTEKKPENFWIQTRIRIMVWIHCIRFWQVVTSTQYTHLANICSRQSLEVIESHMHIGLFIDSKFIWGLHKYHTCSKLRSILDILSIFKHKLPCKTVRIWLWLCDWLWFKQLLV